MLQILQTIFIFLFGTWDNVLEQRTQIEYGEIPYHIQTLAHPDFIMYVKHIAPSEKERKIMLRLCTRHLKAIKRETGNIPHKLPIYNRIRRILR